MFTTLAYSKDVHSSPYAVVIVVAFLFSAQTATAQSTGTFTDFRDGQTYNTFSLKDSLTGYTVTWMTENLNYKMHGTFFYDTQVKSFKQLGLLYTWDAAKNSCPSGWHLPTDNEWSLLVNYFGGIEKAGAALKSLSGWDNDGNGTNTSGFNGFPAGQRKPGDSVNTLVGLLGFWWTSTETDIKDGAWGWNMHFGGHSPDKPLRSKVFRFPANVNGGSSVRCVRNPLTDSAKAESKNVNSIYGPNRMVRTITADTRRNIWLASPEGIIRYDGRFFTNITSKEISARFFLFWKIENGSLPDSTKHLCRTYGATSIEPEPYL